MLKGIIITTAALMACGCSRLEPVQGAPEVSTVNAPRNAEVQLQDDGWRKVIIRDGGRIETTVMLPPITPGHTAH